MIPTLDPGFWSPRGMLKGLLARDLGNSGKEARLTTADLLDRTLHGLYLTHSLLFSLLPPLGTQHLETFHFSTSSLFEGTLKREILRNWPKPIALVYCNSIFRTRIQVSWSKIGNVVFEMVNALENSWHISTRVVQILATVHCGGGGGAWERKRVFKATPTCERGSGLLSQRKICWMIPDLLHAPENIYVQRDMDWCRQTSFCLNRATPRTTHAIHASRRAALPPHSFYSKLHHWNLRKQWIPCRFLQDPRAPPWSYSTHLCVIYSWAF